MIVVSRLKGESMMIGDDLEITVAEVEARRILISISRRITSGRFTFFEETSRQWLSIDEGLPLGDGMLCVVPDIRSHKVRLGFKLPPSVTLHRKEIYDAIRQQGRDDGTPC